MKIVRTITYFAKKSQTPVEQAKRIITRLNELTNRLEQNNYTVQTRRVCIPNVDMYDINYLYKDDPNLFLSVGQVKPENLLQQLNFFAENPNLFCNINLTKEQITKDHVDLLFALIDKCPLKTFNFCFVFGYAIEGAYFPMAIPGILSDGVNDYEKFVIGLQPTNLSLNCSRIDDWLVEMAVTWLDIVNLFKNEKGFAGIDSSIAPLGDKEGSFINIIKTKRGDHLFGAEPNCSFTQSVTTPIYTQISRYIKERNPKKAGICGLMFPCLEDWGLRDEYEKGNFSIERNLFLSLHSGTGIDTYPIGIDESKQRVLEILQLTKVLAIKFNKPLSVRFVSDGISKIGERTCFQEHNFLTNSIIQKL